jgi:hypothetical protein
VKKVTPERWLSHPPTRGFSADCCSEDALLIIMSHAPNVNTLRKCKGVCKLWLRCARTTLCDVDWLVTNSISLLDMMKIGNPTPRLALALATERPALMRERDAEGLLPLQYAAAYRKDCDLVVAIRGATAKAVPQGLPHLAPGQVTLRPVHTRVSLAPIAA